MSMSIQPLYRVDDFFESYAKALENHDTKLMAHHYFVPCTFLSDDATTLFTEASKLEGLFNQGVMFYKQFGVASVKADVRNKKPWSEKIIHSRVNWQYCDSKSQPIYNCDYQYILKPDKNNNLKIHLSVSLNEKERMEAWMNKRKSK